MNDLLIALGFIGALNVMIFMGSVLMVTLARWATK